MPAVTANDVPGYRITQSLGEVMELTVCSANFGDSSTDLALFILVCNETWHPVVKAVRMEP